LSVRKREKQKKKKKKRYAGALQGDLISTASMRNSTLSTLSVFSGRGGSMGWGGGASPPSPTQFLTISSTVSILLLELGGSLRRRRSGGDRVLRVKKMGRGGGSKRNPEGKLNKKRDAGRTKRGE